jgi:hypothetical protein
MRGVITLRDVVFHGGLVWREFGGRCLVRCLLSALRRRPTTFLELAFPALPERAPPGRRP